MIHTIVFVYVHTMHALATHWLSTQCRHVPTSLFGAGKCFLHYGSFLSISPSCCIVLPISIYLCCTTSELSASFIARNTFLLSLSLLSSSHFVSVCLSCVIALFIFYFHLLWIILNYFEFTMIMISLCSSSCIPIFPSPQRTHFAFRNRKILCCQLASIVFYNFVNFI